MLKLITILSLFLFAVPSFAQYSPDQIEAAFSIKDYSWIQASYAQTLHDQEAAIKDAVRAETQAWLDADLEELLESWVQDDKAQRKFFGLGGGLLITGWEGIANWYKGAVDDRTESVPATFTNENHVIRTSGDVAWVTFDQTIAYGVDGQESVSHGHQERTLMKQDGKWKFVGMTTINPDLFDPTFEALESGLNDIGYRFLGLGNAAEAIDVFELNVKLYPDSWNVYDSLGEAHMIAGNKQQAVANYEKSLQLDKNNQNAVQMLAKLKGN